MPADSDDDAGPDAQRGARGDGDALGAAFGGRDDGDGGPPPRAEDAAAAARADAPSEPDDPAFVD